MAIKDLIHWIKYSFMYQKQIQRLRTTATILLFYTLGILFCEITDLIKSYRIVIIRLIKTVIRFVLDKHSEARKSYQSAYFIPLH